MRIYQKSMATLSMLALSTCLWGGRPEAEKGFALLGGAPVFTVKRTFCEKHRGPITCVALVSTASAIAGGVALWANSLTAEGDTTTSPLVDHNLTSWTAVCAYVASLSGAAANLTWNALKNATTSMGEIDLPAQVRLYDERGILVPETSEALAGVLARCAKNETIPRAVLSHPPIAEKAGQQPRQGRPLWSDDAQEEKDLPVPRAVSSYPADGAQEKIWRLDDPALVEAVNGLPGTRHICLKTENPGVYKVTGTESVSDDQYYEVGPSLFFYGPKSDTELALAMVKLCTGNNPAEEARQEFCRGKDLYSKTDAILKDPSFKDRVGVASGNFGLGTLTPSRLGEFEDDQLRQVMGYAAGWDESVLKKCGEEVFANLKQVWGLGSHAPREAEVQTTTPAVSVDELSQLYDAAWKILDGLVRAAPTTGSLNPTLYYNAVVQAVRKLDMVNDAGHDALRTVYEKLLQNRPPQDH